MEVKATVLSSGNLLLDSDCSGGACAVVQNSAKEFDYLAMYGLLSLLGDKSEPSAADMYAYLRDCMIGGDYYAN